MALSAIGDIEQFFIDLLEIHDHHDLADIVFLSAEAGEQTAAKCFGIEFAYKNNLDVPIDIIDSVLFSAEQNEDDAAIEACKALLAKESATV